MARYDFLVETYRAERLKILSAWSQAPDAQDGVETGAARAHPAGAHGASVRQRASLHATMLGIAISLPMLRAVERRLAFLQHDAATSTERLAALEHKPEDWFEEEAPSSMCAAHESGS